MLIKVRDYFIDNDDINRITPVFIDGEKTCVFYHIYFKHSGHYEQLRYNLSDFKNHDIKSLKLHVDNIRNNIAKSLQPHIKIIDFDLEPINNGE